MSMGPYAVFLTFPEGFNVSGRVGVRSKIQPQREKDLSWQLTDRSRAANGSAARAVQLLAAGTDSLRISAVACPGNCRFHGRPFDGFYPDVGLLQHPSGSRR